MIPTQPRRRPHALAACHQSRRHRNIPSVEGLEPRIALSATIYTVDLTTDNGPTAAGSGSGTTGDLRYAIAQANANPNPDGSLIQFDPSVFGAPQTITLSPSLGTLNLTGTAGPEEIDGPAAGVTVSGGGTVGVFQIAKDVAATLSGLTVADGNATTGGGLYNEGTLSLDACVITGSWSFKSGGGLYNGGKANLTDCTLSGDSALQGGGALYNAGEATLTHCIVLKCSTPSGLGGGIFSGNAKTLTLTNCTISGDSAPTGGGGGVFSVGTTTLANCTISGNSAQGGGGISDGGGTTILDGCTISGNTAVDGGGVENDGTLSLTGCAISGNTGEDGAGVWNAAGAMTLTDCTVANNSANGNGSNVFPGFGGGFFTERATLTLTDCTVSGNSGGIAGGGLYIRYGTTNFENTIIAGNTVAASASDIDGGKAFQVTGNYSLIGPGGSGGIVDGTNGNIVLNSLATLGLTPLGNYGGPTQTMAVLPGSAAIGSGTSVSGVTTDQRGAPRPSTGIDIGAFQDQGFTVSPVTGSGQGTPTNTSFAAPLVAVLTENYGDVPLPGATIAFSGPSTGAGAIPVSSTALTDASGRASATVAANSTPGSYVVTASAAGPTSSASFALENIGPPVFFGLTDHTITYGTPTLEISGTLSSGSQAPVGDTVAITLDGVTKDAQVGTGGSFTTTFVTTSIRPSQSAYVITYIAAAQGPFLPASASSQLTVNPAVLTITANSLTMPFGGPVPALTASYTGFVNGDTPASLTTPVALATSATSNSEAGTYPITATGASSTDYVIQYVNGTMTVEPPSTPATPQGRAAQAFATTLYGEVLGRKPEPLGLRYWTRELLRRTPPQVVWGLFGRSRERHSLEQSGRAPKIPLGVAYTDALRAARRAARTMTVGQTIVRVTGEPGPAGVAHRLRGHSDMGRSHAKG
ncbi:MAG: MBG domain-containing protein [Isosphaeraceae bacterium]